MGKITCNTYLFLQATQETAKQKTVPGLSCQRLFVGKGGEIKTDLIINEQCLNIKGISSMNISQ